MDAKMEQTTTVTVPAGFKGSSGFECRYRAHIQPCKPNRARMTFMDSSGSGMQAPKVLEHKTFQMKPAKEFVTG